MATCTHCARQFNGNKGLNTHLRYCKEVPRTQCSYCNKQVINLNKHILKCKDNPTNHDKICKYCGEQRINLTGHILKCSYNPINKTCIHCNLECDNKQKLSDHLKRCESNISNRTCHICNTISDTVDENNLHIFMCDGISRQQELQTTINNITVLCGYCLEEHTNNTIDRHEQQCPFNLSRSCNNIMEILLGPRTSISRISNPPEEQPIDEKVADLNQVIEQLSKKLNYNESSDLLQEHNLCCSVCYEPTTNKTKCSHNICKGCLSKIRQNELTPKCPICRESL